MVLCILLGNFDPLIFVGVMASARSFIFNMSISSDRTFITFYHVTLTFEFDLLF